MILFIRFSIITILTYGLGILGFCQIIGAIRNWDDRPAIVRIISMLIWIAIITVISVLVYSFYNKGFIVYIIVLALILIKVVT